MTVPNSLTLSRIVMSPVVCFIVLYGVPSFWKISVSLLFLFVSITDLFDGFFARKSQSLTNFGKVFDPIADKIFLFSVLSCFLYLNFLSVWIFIFLLIRDFVILMFRILLARRNVVNSSNMCGKWKTAIQFLSVSIFLFVYALDYLKLNLLKFLFNSIMLVSTVLSVISLVIFINRNKEYIIEEMKE